MFRKITVKPNPQAPWTQKLRLFDGGAQSFSATFTPGVNVIVGPNGSGKSVLINALEAFAMQRDGVPSVAPRSVSKKSVDDIRRNDAGINLDAEWNGTLTWKINPQKLFNLGDHTDGIFEFLENCGEEQSGPGLSMAIFGKYSMSAGEKTVASFSFMFKSFLKLASKKLEIPDSRIQSVNEVWASVYKQFNTIVNEARASAERDGIPPKATMMLDEPEMSLDWSRRIELADGLSAPTGAQLKFQIISATHCPAMLEIAENVIETVPGYAKTMDGFYEWLMKKKQQKGWR